MFPRRFKGRVRAAPNLFSATSSGKSVLPADLLPFCLSHPFLSVHRIESLKQLILSSRKWAHFPAPVKTFRLQTHFLPFFNHPHKASLSSQLSQYGGFIVPSLCEPPQTFPCMCWVGWNRVFFFFANPWFKERYTIADHFTVLCFHPQKSNPVLILPPDQPDPTRSQALHLIRSSL